MDLLTYLPLVLLLAVPILAWGLWASLVDRPRAKLLGAWLLRVLGVVLLIVALCQPYANRAIDELHVVFVVDVSASVELEAAAEAVDEVERAIEALRAGDSWSLFALGRGLRAYESPVALREAIEQWSDVVDDDAFRSATHIAGALQQVRLAMPDGKAQRIVLMSDRQPTDGGIASAMAAVSEAGIEVQAADLAGLGDPEASVVAVEPSTRNAFEGEMVRLTVRMASNTAMPAELRILNRGAVVAREDVELVSGANNVRRVDVRMHTTGPSVWTAELVPEQDRFPINNQASTTIEVHGQPRLLVIHEEPRQMRPFARAMEQQQFAVDLRPPHGLPEALDEMLAFDAIVLAKAPSSDLSTRQMLLLKRYVSDFGGGLMMVGSEQSFGLGGYYRTPVEDVLPLVSRYEQEEEQPTMAMVLVIDRSGSMSGAPIALARQASKAAVDMLNPRDQVGVIAFDTEAYVISGLRSASDAEAIKRAIDTIDSGGGTYMYAGMVAAQRMLEEARAQIKHMIVLGDGMTAEADHFGVVDAVRQLNGTVSTVALGPSADRQLLSAVAERGGGRYYETLDPTEVPQIFTHETERAARSAIHEDVVGAVQVADHPALSGYAQQELPLTLGYVMTQAKPTAQVLLMTETGDPLLAVSRFGLGTGMAFTADLKPRWGALWLNWSEFGAYWAQVLRALVRQTDDAGLHVSSEVSADGEHWQVSIDRRDTADRPLSGVRWNAEAVDAYGGIRRVDVEEVGLGQYRARVPLRESRRLTLRLHDVDHDKLAAVHHHRPYPQEYRLERNTPEALANLAAFDAEQVRAGIEPVERGRDVMHWFVLLAIACLIGGIALRRV